MNHKATEVGELVPRSRVASEFNVTPQTIVRWDLTKRLGEPVNINGRNYYRRSSVEAAKSGRVTEAAE